MNILVGIKKYCVYFYLFIYFFFFFFFLGGGGSLQNWDYFWGHFYTFLLFFLRSRYRLEISFGVAIISDIWGGGYS